LKQWYEDHADDPYPRSEEIAEMAEATGRTKEQVMKWFQNKRKRAGVAQSKDRLPQPAVDVLRQWYGDHTDDPYPRSEEIAEMAEATGLTKHTKWFEAERKRAGVAQSNKLPQWVVDVLKQWYDEHADKPYPRPEEIAEMVTATSLTEQQITLWFQRERKRAGVVRSKNRLLKSAVNVLRQWYGDHADDPYHRSEEIAEMVEATGLTEQQITDWFRNERQRRKRLMALQLSHLK
jgi:ATP-dependent protease HslVU (ClpYQ) peptidase subunit